MINFKHLKFATSLGAKVGKVKPKASFKIGKVNTYDISINMSNRTNQVAINSTNDTTCAAILAEQNKAAFKIGKKGHYSKLSDPSKPSLTSDIHCAPLEPLSNIRNFCNDFKKRTGLTLHVPDNWNLGGMSSITDWIEIGVKNGRIPKEIKHVIMSHGDGLSFNGTWRFSGNKEKVFDWIDTNIPKGDLCITAVCETGINFRNAPKAGIGNAVYNSFCDPNMPAKIVESGKHKIIGHYLTTTGVTFY